IHNFTVGVDKIAVVTAIGQHADYTFVSGPENKSTSSSQVHVQASENGWTLITGANTGEYTLSFSPKGDFVGSQPNEDFQIELVGVQADGEFGVDDFFLKSGTA